MVAQESAKEDAARLLDAESMINKAFGKIKVKTGSEPVIYLVNEMAFLRLRKDVEELIKGLFELERALERLSLKEGEASILDTLKMAGVPQDVFQKCLRFLAP